MSLSRLYSVYCEGRYVDRNRKPGEGGDHAEGCPTFSPNMGTSKEARAEAKRLGWWRGKITTDVVTVVAGTVQHERIVDLSPQCAKREGLS